MQHGENQTPDPTFTALQGTLNNLDFPSQGGIGNIAIVNGSVDETVNVANVPGEVLLDIEEAFDTFFAPVQFFANVRTPRFNTNSLVSRLSVSVLQIPAVLNNRRRNIGFTNLDLTAGGLVNSDLVIRGLEDVDELRRIGSGDEPFSFVPLNSVGGQVHILA